MAFESSVYGMAQELLTTFTGDLNGVMIQPSDTSGAYNIYVDDNIIFSRKEQERFPDIKELKQMIRDIVDPERHLGHSDKKTLKEN